MLLTLWLLGTVAVLGHDQGHDSCHCLISIHNFRPILAAGVPFCSRLQSRFLAQDFDRSNAPCLQVIGLSLVVVRTISERLSWLSVTSFTTNTHGVRACALLNREAEIEPDHVYHALDARGPPQIYL